MPRAGIRRLVPVLYLLLAAMPAGALAAPPDDLVAAARAGDAAAQYDLGRLYERGEGVERDDFTAVEWFAKAARNGHGRAALDYGWMLGNGYGVAKDEAAAYFWFARAAAMGVHGAAEQRDFLAERIDPAARREADARLADLSPAPMDRDGDDSADGSLPVADLRDVLDLRRAYNSPDRGDDTALRPALRREAELGDPMAQNLLAVILMRSTARADKLEAMEWLRSAAWAGLPAAQYNLADALTVGVGGELDLRAAAGLLDEALGGLPSGMPRDYDSASRQFRERAEYTDPYIAAVQGYASAATELRQLIRMREAEVAAQLELARRLGQ
ncbi:sel1 repeat family protein [Marivibrio halodurans]|uniref:Sel1 repeat family protein n=1 Tax=Marivibrio halodurans TaxID=2039722 RepID=A0A8J7SIP4_9PROT|nr:tetratricopeptide repeat protein [Marivibrio halodurans]MBP5857183.1 sel1 repeat family protein [Marivibrio halodurans]